MGYSVNSLILSMFLSVNTQQGLPDRDAPKYVAKAVYKELNLDEITKRLEKRYVGNDLRKYGGYAILVTRIVSENKISYNWEF